MKRKFNYWSTHDAARNQPHSSHFASTIKRRKRIVITRNVMSKVSDRRQMTSPWTQIRQSIISSFLSSPRCCGLRSGFGQDLQWQLITILSYPHPPPSSFPPFFHYSFSRPFHHHTTISSHNCALTRQHHHSNPRNPRNTFLCNVPMKVAAEFDRVALALQAAPYLSVACLPRRM
jgi:hypothetical protein